ncbi:MAG: hypothetical protein DHS20C18_49680 [Saprospiraceae bacterium]|nr:MAG: hypothetical protein DHS20C18_49680 [Saprospiraceae bacterium]
MPKNDIVMNKLLWFSLLLILCSCNEQNSTPLTENAGDLPTDWFFRQRAYPQGFVDQELYRTGLRQKQVMQAGGTSRNTINWENAGPINVGGRITDVEMHPSSLDIIYAATASGGIFKSEDQGVNWQPIFDDALSLSIGDMDIAPSNADIIYVGTGEANGGGGSLAYDGVGVYKSTDAGDNWQHLGPENIGSIGKIEIDPQDPDRVYVAAMGNLFGNNPERGVYRTTDGGQNWENILHLSDSTGAIDLAIHPLNPDTIYAVTWERIRRPNRRNYAGPTSGIYRSYDGGDTWTKLTNGLPGGSLNRIGIDISPSDPNILYAVVSIDEGNFEGVYKTLDGGDSWETLSVNGIGGSSFMWWFGQIFVHPIDPDIAYVFSLDVFKTTNGGMGWFNSFPGVHVDQHGLYIHPADPEFVVLGNDGGLFISHDGGTNWNHIEQLPITQFYTCEIDFSQPERLYGGTQDNGSNRTLTGNNDDWHRILGGDGFVNLVDPTNNNFVYASSQYGNFARSINGGVNFTGATTGISGQRNWNTPVIFDPNDPTILFFGSDRVYRSTNRAQSWLAISPILTTAPPGSNLTFGTITTIAVSPADSDVIFVGTDDGRVWRTLTGNTGWVEVTAGLPQRWVTKIAMHPTDLATAYVTISGYRNDEYLAHVFKTTDYGENWLDISAGLPEVPVNDIIVDPDVPAQLYVATDVGVFVSWDEGNNWEVLGEGLPTVVVSDLVFHAPTQTLVAGTYGRSMFKTQIEPPVSTKNPKVADLNWRLGPNPCSELLNISIGLNQTQQVDIQIFDLHGRELKSVFSGKLSEGIQDFQVNMSDLPIGSYVCRLTTSNEQQSARLIIKN